MNDMGVYIPNMSKPKGCIEEWDFGLMGNPCKFLETDMSCILQPESEPFDCGENYNTCPLIEIDDELFKKAESAYVFQQIRYGERRNDE